MNTGIVATDMRIARRELGRLIASLKENPDTRGAAIVLEQLDSSLEKMVGLMDHAADSLRRTKNSK